MPEDAIAMRNAILAKQVTPNAAAKTTATAKRLIATSYYEGGVLGDTVRYTYKPYFGSTHPNLFSYFNMYDPSDPQGVQYIKFDSAYEAFITPGQIDTRVIVNTYDTARRLTGMLDKTNSGIREAILAYNANSRVETYTEMFNMSGTPAYDRTHYRDYDVNGNITDSIVYAQGGGTDGKGVYLYVNNLLKSFTYYTSIGGGMYQEASMNDYVYDSQGRLLSDVYYSNSGSGFMAIYRNIYTYTGTATQYTYEAGQGYDDVNGVWDIPFYARQYVLNGQGMPVAIYDVEADVAHTVTDTAGRFTINYNSSNLLSNMVEQEYLSNGVYDTPIGTSHYYYEDYQTSSIADVANKGIAISLYPNPAQGTVTVHADGVAKYTVTDMQGRVLLQATAQPKATTVDVSALTAGNYIITVQNAEGAKLASKLFSKQ